MGHCSTSLRGCATVESCVITNSVEDLAGFEGYGATADRVIASHREQTCSSGATWHQNPD